MTYVRLPNNAYDRTPNLRTRIASTRDTTVTGVFRKLVCLKSATIKVKSSSCSLHNTDIDADDEFSFKMGAGTEIEGIFSAVTITDQNNGAVACYLA